MENTAQREPIYVPYIVVTGLAPVMPPSLPLSCRPPCPCPVTPAPCAARYPRRVENIVKRDHIPVPYIVVTWLAPAMFSPTCHVSPSLILLIAFIMLSTPIIFPTYHAKA